MKLRIRSVESRETLKFVVPVPCSLQQLKEVVSQILSSSTNSSPTPPDSIRLSLNRTHEIQSSSPDEETLQSLGITSGDLIFYTVNNNSNVFPPETLVTNSQNHPISIAHNSDSVELQNPQNIPIADSNLELQESVENSSQNSKIVHEPYEEPGSMESGNPQREEGESMDDMEIDEDDGGESAAMGFVVKSFSVPGFLRKVFTEELGGDDGGRMHKLLVIAIHAVLLESGFVGLDMNSKTVVKGFQFRRDWPLNASGPGLSLFYTLPEIIGDVSPSLDCNNHCIRLVFQSLGKFMTVYGCLSSGSGSVTHRLRVNEDELVPFLNVVWANCGLKDDIVMSESGILGSSPEKEVFKFWRTAKDDLALPLLIDLCEKAGFGLPPCFMRLPTDLKLKILETLPGENVAKVGCVCSELRYLASSEDLWKQKFVERFGDASKLVDEKATWKDKFARSWERKKRRGFACRIVVPRRRFVDPRIPRFPQVPHPGIVPDRGWFPRVPMAPRVIGGDYDIEPPRIDLPPSVSRHWEHIV